MNTLQRLTLRRNTALSRLASLHQRAQKIGSPAAGVIASALDELGAALEEMEVATEQLQAHVDELAAAREQLNQARAQFDEFVQLVPVPCVWTNADGAIEEANGAAAELLNVSAGRLVGRPLVLFLTEREAFTDALTALNQGLTKVVEVPAQVRPRERRTRDIWLIGRRPDTDARRHCWFLTPPAIRPGEHVSRGTT